MDYVRLGKSGLAIPALGMGTWGNGFRPGASISRSIDALRKGLNLGMTFIDTAESYGSGFSEKIVGEAIKGRRNEVIIATKVSASHLSYEDVLRSAEKSLKRLNIGYIDLYQIHSPKTPIPVDETMRAMERLIDEGKIGAIGVSNFSVDQTMEAQEALSKCELMSNQVKYSLLDREIEFDILPYCQREKITVIAYTPIATGEVLTRRISGRLREIGNKYGKTPIQVALNWLLMKDGVIAIPKALKLEHLEENVGAVGWKLSNEDIRFLESGVC
jgi:aryl-alcohol dehydrogenase-like predicted oxidoreductase|tara:strand:- start:4485 stop:5303 length:819 start_codon:yes stop_codon:yes gene_type:complete